MNLYLASVDILAFLTMLKVMVFSKFFVWVVIPGLILGALIKNEDPIKLGSALGLFTLVFVVPNL